MLNHLRGRRNPPLPNTQPNAPANPPGGHPVGGNGGNAAANAPQQNAAPPGLQPRAKKLYAAKDMAPRQGAGIFTSLKNRLDEGRTGVTGGIGPLVIGRQNQAPVDEGKRAQVPRFNGPSTVRLSTTQQGLQAALDESVAAAGPDGLAPPEPPGKWTRGAKIAVRWARLGLAVFGVGRGPDPTTAQSAALAHAARHPGPLPPAQGASLELVTQEMRAIAQRERAEAVAKLATQVELPDGSRPALNTQAATLQANATQAQNAVRARATAMQTEAIQIFAQAVPPGALHDRVATAATQLLSALAPRGAIAQPTGALMVLDVARSLFGADHQAAAEALEGLRQVPYATLVQDAHLAITAPDTHPPEPALQMATVLAQLPGGPRVLGRLLNVTNATHAEPLRVGLLALSEATRARPAGQPMSDEQREWLGRAAARSVSLTGAAGPASAAEERRRHIAYRGVQTGFMTNEPGSRYADVNASLTRFTGPGLQQTARRNVRAASGVMGRLQNWATAGVPKAADVLPGSMPTVWRRSVLRELVKGMTSNGMLAPPEVAIPALHQTSSEIRTALTNAGAAGRTPAGSMLLAALETIGLGEGAQPPSRSALKRLGRAFFDGVDARMGAELQNLPPDLRDAWTAMRGTHPNAGHVLRLLSEHVDVRALLGSDPLPPTASQQARGARFDQTARDALGAFATLTTAAQAAPGLQGADAALTNLAAATARALGEVSPAAALRSVRLEVFETIENRLTQAMLANLPANARPDWVAAKEMLAASWPAPVRERWEAMKAAGSDAGRVMRTMADALSDGLGQTPVAAAGQAPAGTIGDAVRAAGTPLRKLQDEEHALRFELTVADALTLFADVREAGDAAAVMQSVAARVSLGERLRSGDARLKNFEFGKAITWPLATPATLLPIVTASFGADETTDINMNGAGITMTLASGRSNAQSLGLGVGLTPFGHKDHRFNVGDDDEAGLGLRLDMRAEIGREGNQSDGVSLRFARTGGHEDVLRRRFADTLVDLARPPQADPGDEPYPDLLASLLDRHPELSISQTSTGKQSWGTELAFLPNLTARLAGPPSRDEGERDNTRKAVALGVALGASTKNQRQTTVQTESRALLNIEEFKVSAQMRGEARVAAFGGLAILPEDKQSAFVNPQLRGLGIDVRKQLVNSGVDQTVRLVTKGGDIDPMQTQLIREYEGLGEFLRDLEPNLHEAVAMLAARDDVPGATPAERTGRAWQRLHDTLTQCSAVGPSLTYTITRRMRAEASQAYDALESLGALARSTGRTDDAQRYQAQSKALLAHDDTWTITNLQFKTKAKLDKPQSATLGILQGKPSAETTRLHEFLPAGAQNVGRTPNMPQATPADHSMRWLPPGAPIVAAAPPVDTPYATPIGTPPDTPFATPTGTPPDTPFGTPTGTPPDTPFGTPTGTPPATPFGTPTGTPPATPFGTPTGTPPATPFGTPTGTPPATPFGTPTGTPPATPFGTPTGTPPATPFGTPTGTPPATPFGTPTGTPPATPFGTPTGTPPATPFGTPTGTPPATPFGTPTGTPPATPFGTPTGTPPATPFGTPTGTPPGSPVRSDTARVDEASSSTAAGLGWPLGRSNVLAAAGIDPATLDAGKAAVPTPNR